MGILNNSNALSGDLGYDITDSLRFRSSANAYLSALNKMIIKRDKSAPIEQESQKVRGI